MYNVSACRKQDSFDYLKIYIFICTYSFVQQLNTCLVLKCAHLYLFLSLNITISIYTIFYPEIMI